MNRRRWDSLDIASLVDAGLEGFAQEFYGKDFGSLPDKQASRILDALQNHVEELNKAQREKVLGDIR